MNKKIIILIISILVLGGVSIFFIWNNIEQNSDPHIAILNEKYSDEQMEKFILSYVNDYKIENKGDTIQVIFNAPDFASFIKNLSENSTMDKLDLNNSSNEESTKFVIKELKKMIVNKKIKLTLSGRKTAHGNTEWHREIVRSILRNEKYAGDALMQKTFTVDCITHKVMKNNGERPMYLVTDHHSPIVDRDTFNRVQQELARRNSKRKISDKTITEQGKYSSKYALSELLICGSCGTSYRRQIWKSNGNRYAVWRCISRLEHGKRYCTNSPTLNETVLEKAILNAVNEYFGCRDEIAEILKANIGSVLEYQGQDEIISIENRLKEIDQSRNDLIGLIASGGCDEDKLDGEFEKLYMEEQSLKEQKEDLKEKMRLSADTQDKIDSAMDMIKDESLRLEFFDNVIIRKLVECIKVKSKTELLIIFKGGIEVQANIEK